MDPLIDPISSSDIRNSSTRLTPAESRWAARFELLKSHGYMLRARYRPGWVPSWLSNPKLYPPDCEDYISLTFPRMLDARRIEDDAPVYFKCVPKMSQEVEINRYLSASELRDHPRNHSVPLLDVVSDPEDPDVVILVYPLLRRANSPPLSSVREALDSVHQLLEGLVFLHEHQVAHRDCALFNIMMDARAMFPVPWHPQAPEFDMNGRINSEDYFTRTAIGGVRYYFIDFGLSTFQQDQVVGTSGHIGSPELSRSVPYNPYKVDVFILGTMFAKDLVSDFPPLAFLQPLSAAMTANDPAERPTAAQALEQFKEIRAKVDQGFFSERIVSLQDRPEGVFVRTIRDFTYRLRQVAWALKTKTPLPPGYDAMLV